jgi:Sulfotransferase family
MPYFKNKNKDINILLIHIPKTGGTSIEKYFSKKYSISLNGHCLYGRLPQEAKAKCNGFNVPCTLQHMTYKLMIQIKDAIGLDFNNIKIITAVRNPYTRIMSDIFWLRLLKPSATKEQTYTAIKKYIEGDNPYRHDNHARPQYEFLLDEEEKILPNAIILRTETLTQDMIAHGFTDFNQHDFKNRHNINYDDYLNEESIRLINKYYEKDFLYFNYPIRASCETV